MGLRLEFCSVSWLGSKFCFSFFLGWLGWLRSGFGLIGGLVGWLVGGLWLDCLAGVIRIRVLLLFVLFD